MSQYTTKSRRYGYTTGLLIAIVASAALSSCTNRDNALRARDSHAGIDGVENLPELYIDQQQLYIEQRLQSIHAFNPYFHKMVKNKTMTLEEAEMERERLIQQSQEENIPEDTNSTTRRIVNRAGIAVCVGGAVICGIYAIGYWINPPECRSLPPECEWFLPKSYANSSEFYGKLQVSTTSCLGYVPTTRRHDGKFLNPSRSIRWPQSASSYNPDYCALLPVSCWEEVLNCLEGGRTLFVKFLLSLRQGRPYQEYY